MASNGYPQQGETDHATTSSGGQTTSQQPDQVGWYFVEQYYTTLNNNPEHVGVSTISRLHMVKLIRLLTLNSSSTVKSRH